MKLSLLLGSVLLMLASPTSSGSGTSGDEQAVRDAVAAFYRAVNVMFTGDIGPMEDVWSHADDVTYMGPAGGLKVGWTAVLADWKTQAAMKLGGSLTPEDMQVKVGRDLAVTTNFEKGQNVDANGKPLIVSIRATNTFRKENGAWKMIGHHTDLLPFLARSR